MRILSTKLTMKQSFGEKELYGSIIKWLKNSGTYRSIGEKFESLSKKISAHLEDEHCTVDTFVTKKGGAQHYLFKLEYIFHEQTWTTEIILRIEGTKKEVFFHIDCSGNAPRLVQALDKRTDVIRVFINSGFIEQPSVPITANPIETTKEIEDWLALAVKGEHKDDMPIVFLSQFFDNMAYAADHISLAKKLAGVAYVITCDSESTRAIQMKAGKRTDFNGSVAIYSANSKADIYRPRNVYGTGLDETVLTRVLELVNARVDKEGVNWESLQSEALQAKAELLSETVNENESLEEQLERARARVAELTEENRSLHKENETLRNALEIGRTGDFIIKAPIQEFYEGEQNDFVVNALKKVISGYPPESRGYELFNGLLCVNEEKGNGKAIFDEVKSIFSDGHALTKRDLARLRDIGFEVIPDGKHYKLKFKGSEKYWFTVPKTPGDDRYGKNLSSNIIRRLSIYR